MSWVEHLRLAIELRRWRGLGRTPSLWWRDDDLRAPSPALDRLLALAEGIPIALAVIPDGDLDALAARVAGLPDIAVGQHGVDHLNRRGAGEPSDEHGPGVAVDALAASIRAARVRMIEAGLRPCFYTPPWNRVSDGLLRALPLAGVTVLSAGVDVLGPGALARLDSPVDVLRWSGGPRFKGRGRVLASLRRELTARRRARAFETPVGLLTHHLVHDDPTWAFLDAFLRYAETRFVWRDIRDVTGRPESPSRLMRPRGETVPVRSAAVHAQPVTG